MALVDAPQRELKDQRLVALLPREMKRRLRRTAKDRDESVGEIVRRALAAELGMVA